MTNEEQMRRRYIWVAGFQVEIGWSCSLFQRSAFVNKSRPEQSTSRTLEAGEQRGRRGSKINTQSTTCPGFLQPLATPSRPLGDGGAMSERDGMERKLDKE